MTSVLSLIEILIHTFGDVSTTSTHHTQESPRITELPNELSHDIDIASPIEILRILRSCDAQIFSGWKHYPNLYDFIPILHVIIDHLQDILSDTEHNKVILSGCGTSGRLGWVISRAFNEYLSSIDLTPCFDYCVSGYDKALLTSRELYEDDPIIGVQDLIDRTRNASKVLLIGITCGLSAPYIGGQIEYALKSMNKDKFITVLMGFNPSELSRNTFCEKWNGTTFRDVCTRIYAQSPKIDDFDNIKFDGKNHQILLNPILGPEAITGSTRMKSGSATKILLDIMTLIGCYQMKRVKNGKQRLSADAVNDLTFNLLQEFEGIYRQVYSHQHLREWSRICQFVGNTLNTQKGRILYVGGADVTSIMSFIDASEMKPTFGTPLSRYRSYFEGGWKYLKNVQGDLSQSESEDDRFRVELDDLDWNTLNEDDLVIIIGADRIELDSIQSLCESLPCRKVHIAVGFDDENEDGNDHQTFNFDAEIVLQLEHDTEMRAIFEKECKGLLAIFDDFCRMFAMKLLLNGISTAGHVLSGTVLHNRMINVRVSNDKLFYRAIGMIQQFGKVDEDIARKCLLLSIYGEDEFEKVEKEPISKHIVAARDVDRIVAVGIILATQWEQDRKKRKRVKVIRETLEDALSLRQVIKYFIPKQTTSPSL